MELIIHDALFIERKVEVPEKCPNDECGVSFRNGTNLREWDWHDVQFRGSLSPEIVGPYQVNDKEEDGDAFKPCDYWCGVCGRQVVNGGAIVTVAVGEPLILGETIERRLREARGEE